MPEEAGVALVGVEHLRLGRAGDPRVGTQGAHAADAEQQLLAQPVLGVAAVEAVGDLDVVVGVALDVGVEHQQRHPADAGDPDPGDQVGPAGHRDGDGGPGAVGLVELRDRQAVGVEDRVGLLLPALPRQRLLEVAVAVEQADADDRDAEVAGGLEVVAGEDAEAAGVLRQHGGDAELRGEVGDRLRGVLRAAGLVPAVLGQVAVQVGLGRAQPLPEALVSRELVEPAAADLADQPHRVMAAGLPEPGIDLLEDVLGLGVPRPAQVAGEVTEGGQGVGEDRADRETSNRTHASDASALDLNDPISPAHNHSAERYVVASTSRLGRPRGAPMPQVSRRTLIAGGIGGSAAAMALASWPEAVAASAPFVHGVASGDPLPHQIVLWTRVTPSVEALPGSGVGPDVSVGWEISTQRGVHRRSWPRAARRPARPRTTRCTSTCRG